MKDDYIYIANVGDCKAELYRKDYYMKYIPVKLNHIHNAKIKSEQNKLRKEFPNDPDIIVTNTLGKSCYVKGKLQPTRTIGDLHLKYKAFNEPPMSMEEKYTKRLIKSFNGPYIKHTPEIITRRLEKGDDFIVLASDGLWDFLSSADVSNIVSKYGEKGEIARELMHTAVTRAANNNSLTKDEIYSIEPGEDKRILHDDITILVIDLRDQLMGIEFVHH